MSDIKKNSALKVCIEEINNLGYGVAKIDGKVIFVSGAVTGDTVLAKVIKVNKTYLVAKAEEILVPSKLREKNVLCKAPQSCGGCVYRNITYEHELFLKHSYVENAFKKVGISDMEIESVLSTNKICHYRNKAQYPIKQTDKGIEAGFYASKTHRIISSDDCLIQNENFSPIVSLFCKKASQYGLSVYDENSGKGLLRHLYLRIGEKTGEIMVCIVINGDSLPFSDKLCEDIKSAFPNVVSIMLNKNKKNTNVVLGKEYSLLYGKDYIRDILCGLEFKITPASFYQVNREGAELLYAKAGELANLDGTQTLIDLYCGTGTIGLSLAKKVKKLVGIEIVESAVKCATENAKANGVENAIFFCEDASKSKQILDSLNLSPDTFIIDPPRKGTTKELIEYLTGLKPKKIVYVSCDPDTLARDIKIFRFNGYSSKKVYPVDMFPRTGHVECVCLITPE